MTRTPAEVVPRFSRDPTAERLRRASPVLYSALDSAVREAWEYFSIETKHKVLAALAVADGKTT